MTEEIMNSDGSRNWQANILLDNVKRLEQENKELKSQASLYENLYNHHGELVDEYRKQRNKIILYRSALEEIREIAAPRFVNGLNEEADLCNLTMDRIQNKINEVLKCE